MSKKFRNIFPSSITGREGSAFIGEFKVYCKGQGKKFWPTYDAMNRFSKEEWKEFKSWVNFRKMYSYEDVVSWGWDDDEVYYYFPFEYCIQNYAFVSNDGEEGVD